MSKTQPRHALPDVKPRGQRDQLLAMTPPTPQWHPAGNDNNAERLANRILKNDWSPYGALTNFRDGATEIDKYGVDIMIMPPPKKLTLRKRVTDMIYLTDTAFALPGRGVMLSRMMGEHRLHETEYVGEFFESIGVPVVGQFKHGIEAGSSIRISPGGTFAVVAYGVRATREACDEVQDLLGIPVIPIKIAGVLHTDCICLSLKNMLPLMVFYRQAFAPADRDWDPDDAWVRLAWACLEEGTHLMEVSRKDGTAYATNGREMPCGKVILPSGLSRAYSGQLALYGYQAHQVPLDVLFDLGDGAIACLTLLLTPLLKGGWKGAENGWRPLAKYLWETWIPILADWLKRYPGHSEDPKLAAAK